MSECVKLERFADAFGGLIPTRFCLIHSVREVSLNGYKYAENRPRGYREMKAWKRGIREVPQRSGMPSNCHGDVHNSTTVGEQMGRGPPLK